MMGELRFSNFTIPALSAPAFYCVGASSGPISVNFEHRHNAFFSAYIKKVDASANLITLIAPANHSFESAATIELKKQFDYVHVVHAYNTFYVLSSVK